MLRTAGCWVRSVALQCMKHVPLALVGIDGAGKTSTIELLRHELEGQGWRVQAVANACGRRWLTRRAEALGFTWNTGLQNWIETLLRLANVLRHAAGAWMSSELRGTATIMDRHLCCQLVLRRVRGQQPGMLLPWLAKRLARGTRIVLLDAEPELAWQRIEHRGEDSETMGYLRTARAAYLELASEHGWLVLDASRSAAELAAELAGIIQEPSQRAAAGQ